METLARWETVTSQLSALVRPTPSGDPLTVRVQCRTSRSPCAPARRHEIVVAPDWDVDTPHDLESERLAVAMGGYLSCLELIDTAIPALRMWIALAKRADIPRLIFSGSQERWGPAEVQECCPRAGFTSAAGAADHIRSVAHVSHTTGAIARQVRTLAGACTAAHEAAGGFSMQPDEMSEAETVCVGGPLDVGSLWDAGIHPSLLVAIHREMGMKNPLPARFYLGVVSRRPDLRWVADTLAAARPDAGSSASPGSPSDEDETAEDLASWLAWSVHEWDGQDPGSRARWLASGVTWPLILRLGRAGYDPDEVVEYAAFVRRHPDDVARTLANWLTQGFHPEPRQLMLLAARGVPSFSVPAMASVARLRTEAGALATALTNTELALLVSATGTVPESVAALRRGDPLWWR